MLFGLAIGLSVALAIYVNGRERGPRPEPVAQQPASLSEPAQGKQPAAGKSPAAAAKAPVTTEMPPSRFDFYDMLPKFEVVVQEADRNPRRDQPSVTISKPGAYVLQVTSSRNQADAERLRDRLAKQGINASIQRVTIDEKERILNWAHKNNATLFFEHDSMVEIADVVPTRRGYEAANPRRIHDL